MIRGSGGSIRRSVVQGMMHRRYSVMEQRAVKGKKNVSVVGRLRSMAKFHEMLGKLFVVSGDRDHVMVMEGGWRAVNVDQTFR